MRGHPARVEGRRPFERARVCDAFAGPGVRQRGGASLTRGGGGSLRRPPSFRARASGARPSDSAARVEVAAAQRRPPAARSRARSASAQRRAGRSRLAPVEGAARDLDREVLAIDLAPVRKHHRVLDRARELSHVPREVVRLERSPRARSDSRRNAPPRGEALEKVVHKEREIRLALAKRRDVEVDRFRRK